MNYVEDSADVITVSVASSFLKQMMIKKGSFEIVQNKIREITGLNSLTLNCIIQANESSTENESDSELPFQNENISTLEKQKAKIEAPKEAE